MRLRRLQNYFSPGRRVQAPHVPTHYWAISVTHGKTEDSSNDYYYLKVNTGTPPSGRGSPAATNRPQIPPANNYASLAKETYTITMHDET